MPRPVQIFSQSGSLFQVDTNLHSYGQTVQKPTDLDLHCLQLQGISWFSRTRVNSSILTVGIDCYQFRGVVHYIEIDWISLATENCKFFLKQCRPWSDAVLKHQLWVYRFGNVPFRGTLSLGINVKEKLEKILIHHNLFITPLLGSK